MRTRTTLSSHTVLSSLTKLQGCWWRSNVWFTPRASLWLITNLGGASCGEETPVRSKYFPGALLFQATLPDTLRTAAWGSQSRSNATPQSLPLQLTRLHGAITRAASRGDKAAIDTIPHTLCKRTPSTLRHGQNPDQLQIAIATRMTGRTYHPRSKQTCFCRLTPNKTERPPHPRQHKPPTPTTTKQRTSPSPTTVWGRGSPSDLDCVPIPLLVISGV